MNIEIAEPGRMTQSGSSLLRLIQNNNMPILDLLVRESIQNSLDATNGTSDYVQVEFLTGSFKTRKFNRYLDGVEENLNRIILNDESKYIAIKDSNTVGLTGKMHYDHVENNDYGNLLKLVYEISKPQETLGAGGSWGLGKTIYFRVGIGLVIYYSRILNSDKSYESRLAISLVEDENSKNSIIPQVKNQLKRGIAWWGQKIGNNKTIPITDEKTILEILKVFNIKEYKGKEIGTTVIIPYIDEKKLLSLNKANTEQSKIPYWNCSVEEYLKIAVQRWYSPRIDNKTYPNGKWLKIVINSDEIKRDNFEPIFKITQDLYISAVDNLNTKENINIKSINIRNELCNQKAGCLAYTKVNKEILKMIPPNNKYAPFKYINVENIADGNNKPIVLYTRKPGMIVSYETTGAWVDSIPETNCDEFIIGIFVLNSDNIVNNSMNISLEEYVRQSEKADHTSWSDWAIGENKQSIISKIQSHVRSTISKTYNSVSEVDDDRRNTGLGKLFGDILLPPDNFGNKASGREVGNGGSNAYSVHKGITLRVENKLVKYDKNGVKIPFSISAKKGALEFELDIAVLSENGKIDTDEWESELGQNIPFSLENIIIDRIESKGDRLYESLELNNKRYEILKRDITIKFIFSKQGVPYGINVMFSKKIPFEIKGFLKIKVINRNIKTILDIHMIEGSK